MNIRITRSLKYIILRFKALHWLYLSLHLVLLVIGLLLVREGGTIWIAVGGSLIAAAMAGWVLFLHVWLSQEGFRRLEILQKFGLVDAFEQRSINIKQEYDARLSLAHEAIDIMGFGLRSLRQDYHSMFEGWATRAKVRILLLDPEFITAEHCLADQRDREENDETGTISRDVHAFVRDCSELLKNRHLHFEIRLFCCLPSVNIFHIDDGLFWGPYLIGDVSRNLPTFLVDERGILYGRLLEHFDRIWSNSAFSRPVPNEWLESDATARAH
jgi:hypothetical protein